MSTCALNIKGVTGLTYESGQLTTQHLTFYNSFEMNRNPEKTEKQAGVSPDITDST